MNKRKHLLPNTRSARNSRRGIALPMMAILFAVLLAFMGLVLDGGRIYFEKRRMQAAADAGAYGGAQEVKRKNLGMVVDAGRYDTKINGFEHGQNTIDVQVNNPPSSGPHAGSNGYVEVIISQVVPTYFMRVLNINEATIRARAVAGLENNGDACVVALDPNARPGLRVAGTPQLIANCGIMVNSNDDWGLQANGGGEVHATWTGVSGGYNLAGGGTITPTAQEGAVGMLDPLYGQFPPPDLAGMTTYNLGTINSSTTLNPGRYIGGIKITGSSTVVNFNPGLYVLDSGMDISGGSIYGTGVTFYNTGNKLISITGASQIELTAPDSGDYQGLLFWGDPASPDKNPGHIFRGTSSSSFTGAIYFPSQHVDWAGSNDSIGEWTMLVANTIDLTGNSAIQQINGPPPGILPALTTVTLVE